MAVGRNPLCYLTHSVLADYGLGCVRKLRGKNKKMMMMRERAREGKKRRDRERE